MVAFNRLQQRDDSDNRAILGINPYTTTKPEYAAYSGCTETSHKSLMPDCIEA